MWVLCATHEIRPVVSIGYIITRLEREEPALTLRLEAGVELEYTYRVVVL